MSPRSGLTTRCMVDTHRPPVHRAIRSPMFTTKLPGMARTSVLSDVNLVRMNIPAAAANTPCSARAPNRIGGFTAAPPSAEAAAKPVRPIRNVRRWPSAPLIRPPINSSPPKVSAYAVIAHYLLASDMPSASCADGSAMFAIVPSKTTRSCAALTTANVHHRRCSSRLKAGLTAAFVTCGL